MKKSFRAILPVMAMISFCALMSCQKNISDNLSTATPLQNYLGSDTSLTLYYALVSKANDASLFAGTDSVTVLAPTNTAFLAAGISLPTISGWSVGYADSVIRYHYINASADLVSGTYTSFKSLLSPVVWGFTDGTYNYFNGSPAIKETLSAGAPTLYELNNFLRFPSASLSQLLSADTSLSFFTEALSRTGLGATLGSNGWNTLFAPVNSAFISYGFTNVDTLDLGMLTTIIQYHLISGQYFSNTLASQATVAATDGGYINITAGTGSIQLTGTGNATAANVIAGNELAGNTIIVHKIDQLLLP
ncbi:MAG TPA: fasciclin domain-containing protein [Chitinophagaceae bacterium]|jgi:uncharacterized surface protein with fasciclin (FAS1) repeats